MKFSTGCTGSLTTTSVPTRVVAGCLTRLADLDLTSWRLHGVVTRNGLPVQGATVKVTFYDGSGESMSLQATDVNGAYAILLLGDGLADVLIKEGEGDGETTTRRTVKLARGQPEARLNLELGEN